MENKDDSTLDVIKSKIIELQLKADEITSKVRSDRIEDIKTQISRYAIARSELFDDQSERKARRNGPTQKVQRKYKDASTGKTWNGVGRPPEWIRGREYSSFLVA